MSKTRGAGAVAEYRQRLDTGPEGPHLILRGQARTETAKGLARARAYHPI
jgi:hypothetical protein